MSFTEFMYEEYTAPQTLDRKLLGRGVPLNFFSWKKRKFGSTHFPLLFPLFFTPPSCPNTNAFLISGGNLAGEKNRNYRTQI